MVLEELYIDMQKINLDTDLTPTQKLTQKDHRPKCKQNK